MHRILLLAAVLLAALPAAEGDAYRRVLAAAEILLVAGNQLGDGHRQSCAVASCAGWPMLPERRVPAARKVRRVRRDGLARAVASAWVQQS